MNNRIEAILARPSLIILFIRHSEFLIIDIMEPPAILLLRGRIMILIKPQLEFARLRVLPNRPYHVI